MPSMRSTWRLDASTGSSGPPTTSAQHHRSQRHSGDSRQNHGSAYSGTPAGPGSSVPQRTPTRILIVSASRRR